MTAADLPERCNIPPPPRERRDGLLSRRGNAKGRGDQDKEEAMASELVSAADAILNRVVTGTPRVPGVVAMATDRRGNVYEGAAGKRALGKDEDMTTDSVFA